MVNQINMSLVGPFEKCDADNLTDLNSCLTKTFNEKLNSVITSGNNLMYTLTYMMHIGNTLMPI